MIERIDNVGVAVTDLESALRFHTAVGFECSTTPDMSESDG
jgi:predicted lactoylglutathione lyase